MTVTIEVNPLRLFAQLRHAEMKAKHGMGLARNAGTVRSIREEYGLPRSVSTWAKLADELALIHADVQSQMDEARGLAGENGGDSAEGTAAESEPGLPGNDEPDERHTYEA